MRKFRQYVSTALIVAMIGSNVSVAAAAEDEVSGGGNPRRQWVLENEEWHYYNSEGELRKNEHRVIHYIWYAFNEDGRMYENQLFVGPGSGAILTEDPENGEPAPTRFAYPDGKLAKAGEWLLLDNNEQGSLHVHDSDCTVDSHKEGTSWYYTEKADTKDGEYYKNAGDGYTLGEIVSGKEVEASAGKGRKAYFALGNDGRMYSRHWVQWGEEDEILSDDETDIQPGAGWHYYKYQGERVSDDWLPVDDVWYNFDENGQMVEQWDPAEGDQATPSNAELWLVDSVKYDGKDRVVAKPGETVKLKFKVNLATGSNAGTPVFKIAKHDVWMPDVKRGTIKDKEVDESTSICTISYETSTAYIGSEELCLVVDGKESDTVEVVTKAPETQKGAATAVKDILGTMGGDMTNVSAGVLRDSLKAVYSGDGESSSGASDEAKKEIKSQLLVASTKDNMEALDNQYAMEKKIQVEAPAISDEAKNLLPSDKAEEIQVIGGSLNADPGSTVQLKVEEGDPAAGERVNSDARKIVFDITLDGVTDSANLDIPVIIVMPLPTAMNRYKVKLYHVHGDEEPEEVTARVSYNDNMITFVADRFSNYVFVADGERDTQTNPGRPSGGSGGGGGGSSRGSAEPDTLSGAWQQEAQGWRFQLAGGGYATNTWGRINGHWYYFGADTYMMTGWIVLDGKWYHLNQEQGDYIGAMQTGWVFDPAYNRWFYMDTSGVMQTGWQQVGGVWYYLNPVADGTGGAMLADQWIGDYYVDVNGAWVEAKTR